MNNKVIVITGSSSGIGLATANYLTDIGYSVYGLSRSQAKNVIFRQMSCDITKIDQIVSAFKQIHEETNQIDVVINNAGMGVSGAIEYMLENEFDQITNVNLKALIQVSQIAIPYLRETKGRIINVGSVAGELVIPFQTYYSMTKASVAIITEGLRMELKPFGIQASTVLPGDTKTSFTKNRVPPHVAESKEYQDRIKRSIARMEKDEEHGVSPLKIAKVMARLIKRRKMPIQVVVGIQYKIFVFLKRLLPKSWVEAILYQMYGK